MAMNDKQISYFVTLVLFILTWYVTLFTKYVQICRFLDKKCNLYNTYYATHTEHNLFIKMGKLYKVLQSLLKVWNKSYNST
jgi:hypothetical protein